MSLPQLTPFQIQRGMRMSMLDGILAQAFYGLTWPTSVFVTGLALLLGANNFEIGLLAALAPLLSGIYLLAGRLIEHSGNRKKILLTNTMVHRGIFLALFLLPFMIHFPHRYQIALLLFVFLVTTVFGIVQGTAWMSWMSDLVPEEKRGAFFSKRNMFCGMVWMAEAFLFGKFLDAHGTLWGYACVFGTGVVLAFTAMFALAQQPEPKLVVSERPPSFLSILQTGLSLPGFRNFLLFQIFWGFTTSLAIPFYNVYMLQTLHLDMARITVWVIIGSLIGTLTMPYWGLLGDKAGNKPTLLLCLIGSCVTAFGWLFVGPSNMHWLLPVIYGSAGFFDTGVGLISFNMMLSVMPERDKTSYLGLFEAIMGTCTGLSPLLGGYLATALPDVNLPLLTMTPILVVIALSTVLRIFPAAFIVALPAPHGRDMRFIFREFVFANPFKLFSSLYFVEKSPARKLEAINHLSSVRSTAALPDLTKSMHDLNPRVRRRAVQAMGEIGDPAAVDALIGALEDPLEDIRSEAALALGKIGDTRAVPSLVKCLASSDHYLQNCAAQALGDVRAGEAAAQLVSLMKSSPRTAVMLACADALGRMGSYESVEPILELSRAASNASVKHNLVASAGLLIDDDGELYRALSRTAIHSVKLVHETLSSKVVRFAKSPLSPLRKNLARALQAYQSQNYNEVVVEMKLLDQLAVREYLAGPQLKGALGFEEWVRLLDSQYVSQLDVIQRINNLAGISLSIVDYYARHCPVAAEPDIDHQEFLLALYAFKIGQRELYTMIFGHNILQEKIIDKLPGLTDIVDIK